MAANAVSAMSNSLTSQSIIMSTSSGLTCLQNATISSVFDTMSLSENGPPG